MAGLWLRAILVIGTVWPSLVCAQEAATPPVSERIELEVRVVDEAGEPAANVPVTSHGSTTFASQTQTTDEHGKVILSLVPKQVSGLALWADDGAQLGQVQLPWNQEPPTSLEPVTIKLGPARVMHTRVLDEAGEAVEDATVVLQANYREAARATTDASGAATLRVPRDAPRQAVLAMKSGVGLDYHAFVREGAPQTDPNLLRQDHDQPIELVLNGARQVDVEVIDQNGEPLAGVRVYPWLYRKPNKGEDINLSGLADFMFETDSQGRCTFEVPVDLDRATTVWANLDGYAAPERATFDPKSIDSTVQATLEKQVKLSGTVELPAGVYGTGIQVTVAGDGRAMDGFRSTPVNVNDDGTFELLVNRNMYYQLVAGDNKQWASSAVNTIVLDEPVSDVELQLVPATRVFGTLTVEGTGEPVPGEYLQLYQRTANSYYELPEDEQIPNPTDSRHAISPIIGQSKPTDDQGKFEFFVGPGSYYMYGAETAERPDFEITSEQEKEVNIEVKPVELNKGRIVLGRVVLASDPKQIVANAKVEGWPTDDFGGGYLQAVSDAEGEFEAKQILGSQIAQAATKDKKLVGVTRFTSEDDEYVIAVAPAATLVATLKDDEFDLPLDNRQIRVRVQTTFPNGTFTHHFGGSATTDENGRFEVDGLATGETYTVDIVTEMDAEGNERGWRTAGEVTPTASGKFEQEFRVSALDFPPTFAPIAE
jgi:hypothetical protein